MIGRRGAMGLLGGAAAAAAVGTARAQGGRRLGLFVPTGVGGDWDLTARALERALVQAGAIAGADVVNVPGASGTAGLPVFAADWRGRADALMLSGMAMVAAAIAARVPVDLGTLPPVARLTEEAYAVVVPPGSPHADMRALLAALAQAPGARVWAGTGIGAPHHLLLAMMSAAVGVDPRRTGYVAFADEAAALAAVAAGRTEAGFADVHDLPGPLAEGRVRVLAVSSSSPVPGIDAPTLRQAGIDVEFADWRALFAPPDTPQTAVEDLAATVERATATAAWAAEVQQGGWRASFLRGGAFADVLRDERGRIAAALQALGLAG
jgi:putative tricarboxylic transport membrane protein